MHHSMRALILVILFAACAKETTEPEANASPTVSTPVAPTEAPAPLIAEQPAFITSVATLKREPNEEKKVVDATTKKPVNNWLATLQRGEQVTMIMQTGEYMQVRASDESTGWLKSDTVLPASGIVVATLLEEVKTFSRPDFSALNTQKMLTPGQLLFVTKVKEPFSEVNWNGDKRVWVLTEKLSTDSNEVEASRLVNRARWLEEHKDPAAKDFWDLAKSKFGSTQLLQQLTATATGEAVPTEAAAPTAPTPN